MSFLPSFRTLRLALGVAVGYYLAALLGLLLRMPPATTSVLWPPNAFLTAVLLLTAPRRWWIYLLAALPAHVLVERSAGFPLVLVFALFATNCLEAAIAAGAIHATSDQPTRFDTLRRITSFVAGAVLLAPFVSGFADAGAVSALVGEPFDVVWTRRLPANVLSALVLIPTLVASGYDRGSWFVSAPTRRRVEAALLAGALVCMNFLVFTRYEHESSFLPGGFYAALPLLLPLLIVSAVRFGPIGASLALFSTALVATAGALSGFTPRNPAAAEERVLALQVFLIVVGVPLLVLSALMEERRQNAEHLAERLAFEELLSQLSGAFVHTSDREIGRVFDTWLERVGEFLGVDRTTLWRFSSDKTDLTPASYWTRSPGYHPPAHMPPAQFPGSTTLILREEPLVWPDVAALSDEFRYERDLLVRTGIGAVLVLPLEAGQEVLGCFAIVTGHARSWPPELVRRCRLLADVFASAFARERSQIEAERSRQELAHTLRVSTIGELTTSLAHELNQPLTAILANAQAARRLLPEAGRPEVAEELREILEDVIEEDKRAGEVIHRLRELLRKGGTERTVLDANGLVDDVVRLLGNEVMLRGVLMRRERDPDPLPVHGDRVQLRQVVLNVLMNALEALAEVHDVRLLTVRTEAAPGAVARIVIEDSGPGLHGGRDVDVFAPFFTTKTAGLGMGLSIARSILEAHAGVITARNGAGRGAVFTISLPLDAQARAYNRGEA